MAFGADKTNLAAERLDVSGAEFVAAIRARRGDEPDGVVAGVGGGSAGERLVEGRVGSYTTCEISVAW